MSNHSGSYLLNGVLRLLDRRGVFNLLGSGGTRELVVEIIRLSERYDCNTGEILEDIGEKLGICSWCLQSRQSLVDGVCDACRVAEGWE